MAKRNLSYVCTQCGMVSLKWLGRCEGCHAWNTLEAVEKNAAQGLRSTEDLPWTRLDAELSKPTARFYSSIAEFDRVCGGGLVPGSVLLVGGDPGIGKSTLLLQVAAALANNHPVAYVSGEEALEQIAGRAARLSLLPSTLQLGTGTRLGPLLKTLSQAPPQVLVVDSIQTIADDAIEAAAGTVTQIRACTQALITFAQKHKTTVLLVGHVTKEGVLAGPRVLEHMVDTVLYFEGERGHPFRILRAVKNRFGATQEMGVFDMTGKGLHEVTNPSALFLSHRQADVEGTCVFAGVEGTRPLLVEIQALIAHTSLPMARRTVVGWDPNRLSMILAVLEARGGLSLAGKDVYLSVVGGLRIDDTGADLAVALALISCFYKKALPAALAAFGEISLSGEIRPVTFPELRIREAEKLGFPEVLAPKGKGLGTPVGHVRELLAWFKENARAPA